MILFEEFGDLLAQIPITLILMVCGSFILLISAFSWFAFIKPNRKKANTRRETAAPPVTPSTPRRAYDPAEMPDLDMLVARQPDPPKIEDAPATPTTQINDEPEFLHDRPITKGHKYHVPLNDGDEIVTEELVSVLRDPRDGRLVVYVDGMGYRTLVDSPDVKKKFVGIMRELSDVVTKPDPRTTTEPPPEEPTIETAPPPSETAEVAEPATKEEAPAPAESPTEDIIITQATSEPEAPPGKTTPPPPISTEGLMPGDIPSFKLDDTAPQNAGKDFLGRTKYEFEPVEELDIPGRIEAYLQHKLRHTSQYDGRDIHVRSAPGGLVRIQVDDKYFDAVSDVDEPDIREFLSETIQEWQDRN